MFVSKGFLRLHRIGRYAQYRGARIGERASVVVIPLASHALIPEQPAAVTAAILTWIGKLPR